MPPKKKSRETQLRYKRTYAREKRNNTEENSVSTTVNKRIKLTSHNTAIHSLSDYVEHPLPDYTSIGNMVFQCKSCLSYMWKGETHCGKLGVNACFSTCCMQGSVQLPPISDPPPLLQNLLTEDNTRGKHFREHIRAYNSSLAFASLGVHRDVLPRQGPYTFRISGSVHHLIGNLYPNGDETPKFSQIYIHDSANETDNRLQWNSDLQASILQDLQTMLHLNNPYVQVYKHASEIISQDHNSEWKLILHADVRKDQRRYNLPTTAEISVIIPGTTNDQPMNRDIVLYASSNSHPQGYKVMHINEMHPKYDPLHYVLILPFGEHGWTINIRKAGNKVGHVSPMQFYAYHLMKRDNFNVLLRCGRLFHQYVVDQYAKIEQERLNYFKCHQTELRAELYQGLSDAIAAGDVTGSTVGTKIILPSSFIGGPRNMHQLYQDSMAIVRRYGKPDLFITFTCNPNSQR
ncbi:uncharacterized protein [Ptychodera flava]|uniref:uncharacterized protein isoform X1 n=1 Tax=Ptychodera flava TaxID=63121 RepID=UPI00396A8EC3